MRGQFKFRAYFPYVFERDGGEAGFRGLVLDREPDAQVEDRGLDLAIVSGQGVDDLSGGGEDFLNDAGIRLNIVGPGFAGDAMGRKIPFSFYRFPLSLRFMLRFASTAFLHEVAL
ncbi:MAG: hypothetical protein LBD58_10450 [Treponema sp.]|nr:hypothetical protein [Treponema sp.]